MLLALIFKGKLLTQHREGQHPRLLRVVKRQEDAIRAVLSKPSVPRLGYGAVLPLASEVREKAAPLGHAATVIVIRCVLILETTLGVIPLAALVSVSVRTGVRVPTWEHALPHEAYVDLVDSRLFLHNHLLFIYNVEILVVMAGGGLAAAGIGILLVVPGGRRVVVVHGLLPRLARGVAREVLAEEWRAGVSAEQ